MLFFNFQEPIEHFSFVEMTKTDTGLPNKPSSFRTIFNLLNLAYTLEEIRESFGLPIRVNSAYRSTDVNDKVGGVSFSAHTYGCAADITSVLPSDFPKLVKACEEFYSIKHLTKCIVYRDKKFIHIEIPCMQWENEQ